MAKKRRKPEKHYTHHINWLRAAVLGANDGIVSIASLIVGVASAETTSAAVLLAGVAGTVAGALSMAAGEYVSVSSQADTEKADIERERRELDEDYEAEVEELAEIYRKRGLDKGLAEKVARQLMAKDDLGAHMKDELGLSETLSARPVQAALYSAAAFGMGAALPLLVSFLSPRAYTVAAVAAASLLTLGLLGALSAHAGGANKVKAAARVMFWGLLAMVVTAAISKLFSAVL